MPVSKCPQCQYENEAHRVYCHRCGAKLPQEGFNGGHGSAQNRSNSNIQPRQGQATSGSLVGGLLRVILWAAVFAALIQAARPPDDVPKALVPGRGEVPDFVKDFTAAAKAPRRLVYQQPAINRFLQNQLKASAGPLPANIVRFERAFVNLDAGKVRLTKEYWVLGYPFYVIGYFEPSIGDGALHVKTSGGAVGRLPIAGLIFDRVDGLVFSEFVEGLRPEYAALAKLKNISIRPGEAEVTSGP